MGAASTYYISRKMARKILQEKLYEASDSDLERMLQGVSSSGLHNYQVKNWEPDEDDLEDGDGFKRWITELYEFH